MRKIILILIVFPILSPVFTLKNTDEIQETKRAAIGLNLSHTLILGCFSNSESYNYIPVRL